MDGRLWRWVRDQVGSSRFGGQALRLASATALAQFVAILVSPVVTRLFTPGDFGLYSYYTSWVIVLSVAVTLRYEVAIPLPREEKDAAVLMRLAVLIGVGFALASGVTLGVLSVFGWMPTEFDRIRPYLGFMIVALTFAGLVQSATFWKIRRKEFSDVAAYRTRQAFVIAGLQVGTGLLGAGSLGLIVANTFAPVINVRRLLRGVPLRLSGRPAEESSWDAMRRVGGRYWHFPCLAVPSALANSLALQLPAMLLLGMYGASVAGCFALAMRLTALPTGVLSGAVGEVFLSRIAEAAKSDMSQVRRLYGMVVVRLMAVGAPIFLIGATVAPWVFPFVFGESWREAGYYFAILSVSMLAQFVVRTVSQLMVVLERQGLQLAWDLGRLILVSLVFAFAKMMNVGPMKCLIAYSVVMSTCYFAMVVLHLWLLRRLTPQGIVDPQR
jgi:O-antigen/teichoic acid export membrane protein